MSQNLTIDDYSDAFVTISGPATKLMKFRALLNSNRPTAEVVFIKPGTIQVHRDDFDWVSPSCLEFTDLPESLKNNGLELEEKFRLHAIAREELLQNLESDNYEIPEKWAAILEPHQAVAVAALTTPNLLGVCLFDEQGTGKTLTTVAAFDILMEDEEIDALLIVAPKTLIGTWLKEFRDFIPGKYSITQIQGDAKNRLSAIYSNSDVYVTSYETLNSESIMLSSLVSSKRFLIVFDESFAIKNSDAQRSQAAISVRSGANRALLLCGTPAPNSALDLVHQFDVADMGFTFQGIKFTGGNDQSATIRALVETRGTYIRRLKSEVLPDLATKHHEIHKFDLVGRQLELYTAAKSELELFLKRIDNKTFRRSLATYFQKRAALLQICVSPALIGDNEIESGKYRALLKLVNEILSNPTKKVVVWSSFTKSTDHLMMLLREFNPVRLDGTVNSQDERQLVIKRFQESDDVRVFIGNPAAAGAGITLTRASDSIYVSLPGQAAYYMQSLDRTHRIGQQEQVVNYHFLIGSGTIEEHELKRLSDKQQSQGNLFSDKQDSGTTLEQALNELL